MRFLKIALGLAISAVLLAVLLWRVDTHALVDQLRHTHPGWAAGSMGFAVLGIWTRARRWHYLYPPGSNPPALFRACMIGYMANNILPLRAGEIVRVGVVARHWRQGFWLPLATLIVERVLDGVAIVLMLAVLVVLLPVPAALRWAAVLFLALDMLAMLVLAAIAAAPGVCRRLISRLTRVWPPVERRVVRVFETFVRGLTGVQTPRHAGPLLVWSVIVWVVPMLAAWTALFAAGLTLPPLAAWAVVAFVGLGISLPSAPGYVGVFHAAAILALAMFGVPEAPAFGAALIFHACGFIPVTLFGWILLLREPMSLGEATRRPPAVAER